MAIAWSTPAQAHACLLGRALQRFSAYFSQPVLPFYCGEGLLPRPDWEAGARDRLMDAHVEERLPKLIET